ncbi:hypothetical protein [Actinokineospora sp. HUAS TT18]|uniref:hypothetical protein n=1 Tax=Actinokineospora sp. HUAS TT18 TaxID=3447451 RepID=UPI003F51E44D
MTAPQDDYQNFDGVDALGEAKEWRLRSTARLANPGSLLVVDRVVLGDDNIAERKRLPATVSGEDDWLLAETQLDNEIRALVRLANRYPGDYPPQLPQLIGYNFDAAEPFVLMRVMAAEPLGGDAAMVTLLSDDRRRFVADLFRAVAALHAVDLVHGSIQLSSVRRRGDEFQLVGLEHSAARGETPRSRPVTLSHRDRRGSGTAAFTDDLRDAASAVFEMVAGRRPDRELDHPARMIEVVGIGLRDVFAAPPGRVPTAREILSALHAQGAVPDPIDVAAALRKGWESYEIEHPRPTPPPPVQPPRVPTPPPPPPPVAQRPLWTRWPVVTGAVAVIAGAVATAGFLLRWF